MPIPSTIDSRLERMQNLALRHADADSIGAGSRSTAGLRFQRQARIAGAQFAGRRQMLLRAPRRRSDPATRRESANSNSLPSLSSASASDTRRSANKARRPLFERRPERADADGHRRQLPALRHQPRGLQRLAAGPQHMARRCVQRNDAIAVGGDSAGSRARPNRRLRDENAPIC